MKYSSEWQTLPYAPRSMQVTSCTAQTGSKIEAPRRSEADIILFYLYTSSRPHCTPEAPCNATPNEAKYTIHAVIHSHGRYHPAG